MRLRALPSPRGSQGAPGPRDGLVCWWLSAGTAGDRRHRAPALQLLTELRGNQSSQFYLDTAPRRSVRQNVRTAAAFCCSDHQLNVSIAGSAPLKHLKLLSPFCSSGSTDCHYVCCVRSKVARSACIGCFYREYSKNYVSPLHSSHCVCAVHQFSHISVHFMNAHKMLIPPELVCITPHHSFF